jgi:peptidoglycan hydrolase-like protein with peptidoglycan-binding domain
LTAAIATLKDGATMTATTADDEKDHVNHLVPEIRVSDGVEVPVLPKWVPQWALSYGNGNIPTDKMTLVDPSLKASGAGYLVPEVAVRWQSLQQSAKAAGYDLSMTGAYRTLAQQVELFRERYTTENTGVQPRTYQGKTYWLKPGNAMVASPGTSNHGWGCAIDMALQTGAGLVAVTAQFVSWAAGVAVAHGFSWEDSESWHIHAIDMGANAPAAPSNQPQPVSNGVPQPTLQLGSSGQQVALLQQLCTANNWGDPGHADGKFGPRTQAAVKAMQTAIGATADGVYGPHTAAQLAAHLGKST